MLRKNDNPTQPNPKGSRKLKGGVDCFGESALFIYSKLPVIEFASIYITNVRSFKRFKERFKQNISLNDDELLTNCNQKIIQSKHVIRVNKLLKNMDC